MNKKNLMLAAAVICAVSAPALADELVVGNNYARLSGGIIMPEDIDVKAPAATGTFSFDNGWTVAGAFGTWVNDNLTVEGEVSYLTGDFDELSVLGVSTTVDGGFSSTLLLANASYHFGGKNAAIDPYVGGGAGAAFSDIEIKSVGGIPVNGDSSGTDLAFQAGAGINMKLSDGFTLGAQYRYLYADTGDSDTDGFSAHNVMASATLAF